VFTQSGRLGSTYFNSSFFSSFVALSAFSNIMVLDELWAAAGWIRKGRMKLLLTKVHFCH